MANGSDTLKKQLEALNRHDAGTFASFYRSDVSVFDPAYPDPLRGQDAVRKDMEDFVTAFPDLEMKIERVIEDGSAAAYEIRMTGTHKGPLLGPAGHIPATDKRIEVGGGVFARFDNEGRIIEERRYYDLAGLLGQIGLLQ